MNDRYGAVVAVARRHWHPGSFSVGLLLCSIATLIGATEPRSVLPGWFETNRVQAHFENDISDDLGRAEEQARLCMGTGMRAANWLYHAKQIPTTKLKWDLCKYSGLT